MPPTPSSQNAVILGSSAKPTTADLGVQGSLTGTVIRGFNTEFPFVQDTYHDHLMNRISDVGYDYQFVVTCEAEILQKAAAAVDDHLIVTDQMLTLVEPTALVMLASADTRNFDGGFVDWSAGGIFFILTEGSGTFERNKPRRDRMKYEFRRYDGP